MNFYFIFIIKQLKVKKISNHLFKDMGGFGSYLIIDFWYIICFAIYNQRLVNNFIIKPEIKGFGK
jgi:hypothetical protein